MPKIILRCNYLRDAPPEHLVNYVKYIGTREGVDKIDDSKALLPATVKQENLIKQILKDIDGTKDMLEYGDYLQNPTRENASEFIALVLENNLDLIGKRKNYVDYIANRPRVERIGEHGLFTDVGTPVVLSQVADEVANQKGVVWTHVISLRREDAARLGYDSGKEWQELIRSKKAMLCKNMKISSENLRWYAAFHNESHHPHVHLLVYSKDGKEGFLTNKGIEAMRSELAHSIFRQDFMNIYDRQNENRSSLKESAEVVMHGLISEMQSDICENKIIEEKILLLSERLKHTAGKKQYGYLKADVKALIDQIVDELEKDERVARLYALWNEAQNDILKTYTGKFPPIQPLSKQKQFKSIKNMVIAEALNIGSHRFTFEAEEESEPAILKNDSMDGAGVALPTEEPMSIGDDLINTGDDFFASDQGSSWEGSANDESAGFHYHVSWSGRYKEACVFLYGSDNVEQNFAGAHRLFMEEAETGNALAMHELGRMHIDGLGVEMDVAVAQEWYGKALSAFLKVEAEKPKPYTQYRIGKMYATGLGTTQDYEEATGWFEMAVAKNHKYAQYSLAGLYYQGHGVEQNFETAFDLYQKSAMQKNPYASYELAKMLREGIGTENNMEKADEHFQKAFTGFSALERDSHDDKLQYRLGHMLYTGIGIKKNIPAAIEFFEKAAKLGNVYAQYMLGKIYLDTDSGYENVEKALLWLTKAADNGNDLAQYFLGKLYHDGVHIEKDIAKALTLFTESAEQKNQYAAYALGKLYLSGEDVTKDVETAIKWLTASAEQGNQYAQYALGKLYLIGHDIPQDQETALKWLNESAAQGNIYAQFLIDHINSFRNPSVLLATTRLMHHLGNIFREEPTRNGGGPHMQIDRKLRKRLMQKKSAQGHAYDDHVSQQSY